MSARSHDIARDSERRARLWVMLTGGALGSVFGGLASIKAMNTWEVHSYLVARQWALLADRVAPYAPPLVLAGLVLGLAAGIGMSRLLPTVRMPAAIRSPLGDHCGCPYSARSSVSRISPLPSERTRYRLKK